MQIYLIGFMGTGKSTVARKLAPLLKRRCLDTDDEITKKANMTIPKYFEQFGEAGFRKLEHEVLEEISKDTDAVISCGGGVALFENNVAVMKQYGRIVLLDTSPEVIFGRIKGDANRPLLKNRNSVEKIAELMSQRAPYYKKAADITISCDGRTPTEIAAEIKRHLEDGEEKKKSNRFCRNR